MLVHRIVCYYKCPQFNEKKKRPPPSPWPYYRVLFVVFNGPHWVFLVFIAQYPGLVLLKWVFTWFY